VKFEAEVKFEVEFEFEAEVKFEAKVDLGKWVENSRLNIFLNVEQGFNSLNIGRFEIPGATHVKLEKSQIFHYGVAGET
jgi:hypothetical protein